MGWLRRSIGPRVAVCALLVTSVAAAACSGEDITATDAPDPLSAYQETGVVLGIADEKPHGFEAKDGTVTGIAPTLATAIFEKLGIAVKGYVVTDFRYLIDGLHADRMDVIAAGMFITPERAQDVLFANPDYCGAAGAFAVEEGNPHNLTSYEDFRDKEATLGVLEGAVEVDAAEEAGVPDGKIDRYQHTDEMFAALEDGEIDALALTKITVDYEIARGDENDDGEEQPREGLESVEVGGSACGALGFRYEDNALRDAFNEQLAAMQDAGETWPIVEDFYSDRSFVEQARGRTLEEIIDA